MMNQMAVMTVSLPRPVDPAVRFNLCFWSCQPSHQCLQPLTHKHGIVWVHPAAASLCGRTKTLLISLLRGSECAIDAGDQGTEAFLRKPFRVKINFFFFFFKSLSLIFQFWHKKNIGDLNENRKAMLHFSFDVSSKISSWFLLWATPPSTFFFLYQKSNRKYRSNQT